MIKKQIQMYKVKINLLYMFNLVCLVNYIKVNKKLKNKNNRCIF